MLLVAILKVEKVISVKLNSLLTIPILRLLLLKMSVN